MTNTCKKITKEIINNNAIIINVDRDDVFDVLVKHGHHGMCFSTLNGGTFSLLCFNNNSFLIIPINAIDYTNIELSKVICYQTTLQELDKVLGEK